MNPTPVIRLDQAYAHPPTAVWKALTDPELHAKWWAAGDVRPLVGHRFELDMGPFGKQPCEVLAVVPGQLFKVHFSVGRLDTLITWQLSAEGDGTRLTLVHEGFKLDTPMGKQAYEGMGAGWPGILQRLEGIL